MVQLNLGAEFTVLALADIQNKWLVVPSPTMAPSTAFQLSGCSLAGQRVRVAPSNMLIQPSWPARGELWAAAIPARMEIRVAAQTAALIAFMALFLSRHIG